MKVHPRQIAIDNNESTYHGKPCKKCGNTLRYTSMTGCVSCTKENSSIRNKTGVQKEYIQKNREKINAYNRKAYHSLTAEEKRNRNRKQQISIYGLTFEQYDAMLLEQNGACAICGKVEKHSSKGVLSIDHDHKSGKIRGLLCDTCNRGLGHFYDNVSLLHNAIKYLK